MQRALLSIRLLVTLAVVTPIVAVSAALLWLASDTGQRIERQLSQRLVQGTSRQASHEIYEVLNDARQIGDLYRLRLEKNIISHDPLTGWEAIFFTTISPRPRISSLSFATPDGRAIFVMRVGSDLIAGQSTGPGQFETTEYLLNPRGDRLGNALRTYHYDVTVRPWYQRALESKTPAWTRVYEWFDQNNVQRPEASVPSIGYVQTVYKPDGTLLGVVSVDVTMTTLAEVLRASDVARDGMVAVLDADNRVLASSREVFGMTSVAPLSSTLKDDDDARCLRATLASHLPIEPLLSHRVQDRYVSIKPLQPFPDIDWRLALVVPDAAINRESRALLRTMLWTGVAATAIAMVVGIVLARVVGRPIERMADDVRRAGTGDTGLTELGLSLTLPTQSTRELAHLRDALHDMAGQLREQVTLRAATESAESANRARSAFFARATHELRTPLNAIIGYTELIDESEHAKNDPQTRADLARILQAGRQLLTVINNVLNLSKIEAGKLTANVTSVNISELLNETIDTARPLVQQNDNTLTLNIAPGVGTLHTDHDMLRQVLLNLLSNAARHTRHGSVQVTVDQDKTVVHLCVSDTGEGIRADALKQIFDPFFQARPDSRGTGLGLSISRELVQLVGGQIDIESTPGRGTSVHLYYPLDFAETPPTHPIIHNRSSP